MRFLSYAQNLEDVMLWRCLSGVQEGRYIDVGAAEPDIDSVTRAFYERGWRGINIEPNETYFARLAAERPRDINLCVALGAEDGERAFNIVETSGAAGAAMTGLSTLDPDIAERHRALGFELKATRVTVKTLREVSALLPGEVHFLKIDVEGAEREVLRGADFSVFRPWIVLLEATLPNSPEPCHQAWEPLMLDAGYRFVWFDGLNRFYVAAEHHERLSAHFQTPPNVFDGYRRFGAEAFTRRRDRLADAQSLHRLAEQVRALARDMLWRDAQRARKEGDLAGSLALLRLGREWYPTPRDVSGIPSFEDEPDQLTP